MKGQPQCPRCGAAVRAPSIWSSDWSCEVHGAVDPLQPVVQPSADLLRLTANRARVPLWLPWPLPHGWLVTGLAAAGDERTGLRAVAVACSGPAPLGGMGELLLVCEELGVGLGARYAGLPGPDPGPLPEQDAPHARFHAGGHPIPLWHVEGPADRAIYVGAASGNWLWAVLWPEAAGALLLEDLVLADLRDVTGEVELVPIGALSPRVIG
jgi:hypothetical protein